MLGWLGPLHLSLSLVSTCVWQRSVVASLEEVFWRLTLDALPTAARLHNAESACICGALVPNWLHHF